MLIKFKGEHTGRVVMFGKNATTLLKMMGQSGNTKGAITAPDVAAALAELKTALGKMQSDDAVTQDSDQNNEEQTVSLQTRAVPLINLLEESVTKNGYVMWEPE